MSRVRELIARLLALADPEKNDNEHERKIAKAKAEALMKEHGITKEPHPARRPMPEIDDIMGHWRQAHTRGQDPTDIRAAREELRKKVKKKQTVRQAKADKAQRKTSTKQREAARKSAADALRAMGIDPETFMS